MFTGLFIDSFILSPYIEQSKAELVWDIAAGPSSYFTPNVLSELSYKDIKSRGLGIRLAHLNRFSDNWAFYIEANYSDTSIKSGKSQDSDYLANNRQEEFSRSYADIKDDGNRQQALAIGLKTRWFGAKGHYVTMLLGHQQHDVDLTVTNGVQAIPEEMSGTELTGLNATYNSEFESWYAGLATEHVFSWGTIGLRYEHHDLDFESEADWNLRDDLAHPKSFVHSGDGDGKSLTLGYSYQINLNWDLYLNYTRLEYTIRNGYDQTFFADGASYVTSLNQLKYESDQFQLGFRYIF